MPRREAVLLSVEERRLPLQRGVFRRAPRPMRANPQTSPLLEEALRIAQFEPGVYGVVKNDGRDRNDGETVVVCGETRRVGVYRHEGFRMAAAAVKPAGTGTETGIAPTYQQNRHLTGSSAQSDSSGSRSPLENNRAPPPYRTSNTQTWAARESCCAGQIPSTGCPSSRSDCRPS